MSALDREVRAVLNPALGAALLWRFAYGYRSGNERGDPAPIPLVFLTLPVLLDEEISTLVARTQPRSGLRAFVAKFSEARTSKTDLLLGIHKRASVLRELTAESLALDLK
jgi:hypothetical protein